MVKILFVTGKIKINTLEGKLIQYHVSMFDVKVLALTIYPVYSKIIFIEKLFPRVNTQTVSLSGSF